MSVADRAKLKWGLVLLLLWGGLGFYQFRTLIYTEGWIEVSRQLELIEIVGWGGLLFWLVLTIFAWVGRAESILSWIDKGVDWLRKFRFLSLVGVVFLYVAFPLLILGYYGMYLTEPFTRTFVYIFFGLIIALLLSVWRGNKTWLEMLPASLLSLAVLYNAASYIPHVSAFPFSLGWSEASRYYYSSLLFAEQIYGQATPLPHSNFSRYLMQSLPFIFPTLPLWAHRLWQAVMRFVFPYLGGFVLARRLGMKSRFELILFALWAGLFLFQGPVFYQMMMMVILVLWLFDSTRFWQSLSIVALASIWAGLTRINWVPMPGLMAAALYLMEIQVGGRDVKSLARYLWQPAVWVGAGGLIGLAAQAGYIQISGLPPELLTGALSQELLWYRLWPNLSYPPGVFFAILLVSAPLLVFIVRSMRGWRRRWHPLRWLGLAAILLVLFVGGVIISVKIGGGTNLHNLDAFLTILLLLGVYIFYGKFVDRKGEGKLVKPGWPLLSLIILIPAIFAVMYGGQLVRFNFSEAEESLDLLQRYVDQAKLEEGEILFVSERHLLTFNYIEGVELVHDYEQMILMEMAMAGNQTYLDSFQGDLESFRFSLIVHSHLPARIKDNEEYPLAEENNVYLERVASGIKCYYDIKERITLIGVDVLVPKETQVCD